MSERLEPEEVLPTIKLQMPDGEFEATPDNTTLFRYMGALACYTHIFLQMGETEEGAASGSYIFNQHPVFPEMLAFMSDNYFPAHLNLREVADCDVDAFNRMIHQSANDLLESESVPEDWLDEGTN